MGTTTPNIGLYIPADGETNYGTAFANGMLNLDTHDHSGAPSNGVPLSSAGLADGSVTASKLNDNVLAPDGGLDFTDPGHQIETAGLLKALFGLGSNGILVRTSSTSAANRTIVSADSNIIAVTNGDGVAGNPSLALSTNFFTTGIFTPIAKTSNGDLNVTSYASQIGKYQRIGNWLLVFIDVQFTADAGTGDIELGNFPVACVGSSWLAGYLASGDISPNQQVASFQVTTTNLNIKPVGSVGNLVAPATPFTFNIQAAGIYPIV